MAQEYQYPITYTDEIPFWCEFACAPYSVLKENRTRSGIYTRATHKVWLPFTSEPKMSLEHQFAQGTNPVGPVLSLAGLKNTSGSNAEETFLERLSAPVAAFYEATFTTDTFRRFSNITEATMTSEARRQFSFKYLFVPKSETESAMVDSIITIFRNMSYPKAVENLPERTFPQNLWTIKAAANNSQADPDILTSVWLGDPLPCVLNSMMVEKGDPSDPVLKFFPDTTSFITTMTLNFMEFETGTYSDKDGILKSKSEIAEDGG